MFITIRNLIAGPVSLPGPLPRLKINAAVTTDITPEEYDIIKEELGDLEAGGYIELLVEAGGSFAGNFVFDNESGAVLYKGSQIAPNPPSASDKVRITGADIVPGFLEDSIIPGTGLSRTILNSGADEKYQLDVTGAPPIAHATTHQNGGADEIATITPAANAIPKADGSGKLDAWVDHTPLASVAPVNITKAASEVGISSDAARQDHKHDITTALPGTIQPDTTAAEGTATSIARSDHTHAIVTEAPTQGIGGGNAKGDSTSFARSNHDHTIRETNGPTNLTVGSIENGYAVHRSGTTLVGVNPFNPARTIVVAKDVIGANATNIAAALILVANLSPAPDAANPAVIIVYPGVYSTAPFAAPAFVTITGIAKNETILDASSTTSQLVTGAASATMSSITIRGANGIGGVGVGFKDGGVGRFELTRVVVDDCTDGIYVDGVDREILLDNTHCIGCSDAYRIGINGGALRGHGAIAENDAITAMHLRVESSVGIVYMRGADIRDDKVYSCLGSNIDITHSSSTPQEHSFRIISELQVGSPAQPRETCLGEGDSYTRCMVAKSNTNGEIGTWVTLDNLLLEDNISDPLFQGVAAQNTFYIGGIRPVPGIKVLVTTARVGGDIVAEYWDGAAWIAVKNMSTCANYPYSQCAQDVFSRTGSEQIRLEPISGWAMKILDGIEKYWLRFRIVVDITTIPAVDKAKLHSNRMEVNKDGRIELFGSAESLSPILFHHQLTVNDGKDGGDYTIDLATILEANMTDNGFENGQIRSRAILIPMVEGIDTTRLLEVEIDWIPLANTVSSDVNWEINHVLRCVGDILDGTNLIDGTISVIENVAANTINKLHRTILHVPIENAVPGDVLAMSVFRNATAANLDDTFVGDIAIVSLRAAGYFWLK